MNASLAKNKINIRDYIKREKEETIILFRSVPATVVSLFVVSVICMNLLANKTLIQTKWLALDGGILMSWLSFMCMDLITMYFGVKASNKIAIFATLTNLFTSAIFYVASIIPSKANDYTQFNIIFGGTWFILLGSTVAFLASAVINNFLNSILTKVFHKTPDKVAYAGRIYISTFIGQFFDNIIFAIIVFVIFAPIFWDGFHWTILQCIICALSGATAELLMEIIFSPVGYKILNKWKADNIGAEYISYVGR